MTAGSIRMSKSNELAKLAAVVASVAGEEPAEEDSLLANMAVCG